jgi:hypothetical protein
VVNGACEGRQRCPANAVDVHAPQLGDQAAQMSTPCARASCVGTDVLWSHLWVWPTDHVVRGCNPVRSPFRVRKIDAWCDPKLAQSGAALPSRETGEGALREVAFCQKRITVSSHQGWG